MICLVIAILNRSLMIYHYSEFVNYDEKAQLSVAFNFIRGDGLSEIRYSSSNPDVPVYDLTQRWPPGYSIVVAPFLVLFNNNEFLATTCIDIIAGILFIFLVLSLCKLLSVSVAITNISILIAGCFQYYIFIQSFPSDHLALVSILAGLILCIKVTRDQKKLSAFEYFFASVVFFFPFFFRYMYLPVTLLLPASMLLFSFITRNKRLRITTGFLFTGTLLLTAALLTWTKIYSGHFSYIVPTEKGWFPKQLLHWYPFAPSAFINIEAFTSFLGSITKKEYGSIMRLVEIVNIVFLVIIFYLLIRKNRYPTAFRYFLFSGTILSTVIIFLLGYLTLTNRPQAHWNYNIEGRYFIFPVVFLQLLFLIKCSFDTVQGKSSFTRVISSFILLVMLLEAGHGVYSTTRNIITTGNNPFPTKRYLSYSKMITIFNNIKNRYPQKDILLTSPNEYYLYAANNAGFKPVYDFDTINNLKRPNVTQKTVLITALNDDDAHYMEKYLSERKPVKFAYESFVSFFAEEIDPLLPQ